MSGATHQLSSGRSRRGGRRRWWPLGGGLAIAAGALFVFSPLVSWAGQPPPGGLVGRAALASTSVPGPDEESTARVSTSVPGPGKENAARASHWINWTPGPESEPDRSGYDALHVDLTTEIEFATETIVGEAVWLLELREPLPADLCFDFSDAMTVTGAWIADLPARFFQAENRLHVTLGEAPIAGERMTVRLTYGGSPERGFLLGFEFRELAGVPVAYTNCEPVGARTWWPCKDRPDEKFTADLRFIVPDTLVAASNGLLEAVTPLPDGRRCYHWVERYPIPPYLISVVATDFACFADEYATLDGRRMPLTYYAFPAHLANAQRQWAVTPEAITFLARTFGEYPFVEEKYGMAQFPWGGAMEHQTLTSMGSYFLDNPAPQDWIIVHELAHQWWGNWVTCGTWRDIWLNEGFAVYCEALWAEHRGGIDSLHAHMAYNRRPGFAGSVYDPDFIFNATVYRKGAWVLHMLRHVVGEKTFFSVLGDYGRRHAYATAVTEDLRTAFAAATGDSLHWFFDPWVYGEGRPLYGVWWDRLRQAEDGQTQVRVRIVQEPSGPQLFTMPLDARFLLSNGEIFETTLWDSLPEQEFLVTTPAPPESLIIDPEQWVLCRVHYGALPSAVAGSARAPTAFAPPAQLGAPYPNPAQSEIWIPLRWRHPVTETPGITSGNETAIELAIYDAGGRLVRRLAPRYAGPREDGFHWDGRATGGAPAPAGVYFGRLEGRGLAGETRPGTAHGVRLLLLN